MNFFEVFNSLNQLVDREFENCDYKVSSNFDFFFNDEGFLNFRLKIKIMMDHVGKGGNEYFFVKVYKTDDVHIMNLVCSLSNMCKCIKTEIEEE